MKTRETSWINFAQLLVKKDRKKKGRNKQLQRKPVSIIQTQTCFFHTINKRQKRERHKERDT